MKKPTLALIFVFMSLSLYSLEFYQELSFGYYGDMGTTLALRLDEDSADFPFFIQGRIGYIYQEDPGNAEEARKIFINDNAGGNIQKYGESYLVALDLGWKWKQFESLEIEWVASGLWNYYQAHFAFVGNNEAFAVKSAPFGVGLGGNMRLRFRDSRSSLILKGGVEYFPKTLIDAHGTFYYTPDGQDDNPRNAYTYEDADAAVNQPDFRIFLQIGLLYPIG